MALLPNNTPRSSCTIPSRFIQPLNLSQAPIIIDSTYPMWQNQTQLDLLQVSNGYKICSELPTLSDTTSAYPLRWIGALIAAERTRRALRAIRREFMMCWGINWNWRCCLDGTFLLGFKPSGPLQDYAKPLWEQRVTCWMTSQHAMKSKYPCQNENLFATCIKTISIFQSIMVHIYGVVTTNFDASNRYFVSIRYLCRHV